METVFCAGKDLPPSSEPLQGGGLPSPGWGRGRVLADCEVALSPGGLLRALPGSWEELCPGPCWSMQSVGSGRLLGSVTPDPSSGWGMGPVKRSWGLGWGCQESVRGQGSRALLWDPPLNSATAQTLGGGFLWEDQRGDRLAPAGSGESSLVSMTWLVTQEVDYSFTTRFPFTD